ncbi:MAG TPA: RdgB/HAM1 family non-canonical purine NTP pyrophosphatase [Alphaproteobacteria bacterium]|nr:RdgB/HAM1 family non-canonical purine NTP pyrophosphatase [Alphaproteobacteria bacterium]
MRRFEGGRLVIATHNKGKWREFAELLSPYVKDIVAAGDLGLPEPDETGATFEENAIIKARAAATISGSVALADDSGLCVHTLNGAPGIYSARWGGLQKDFRMAMTRVHEEMGAAQDRSAHFACVLALAWPDGHCETVEGRVDGNIVWPPRGEGGHGYDPVFVPEGCARTFAEMGAEEKNALSHRGRAVGKLIEEFFSSPI